MYNFVRLECVPNVATKQPLIHMRTDVNNYMVSPLILLRASIDIAAIVFEQFPSLRQLACISHKPFLVDWTPGEKGPIVVSSANKLAQIDTNMCVQDWTILRGQQITIGIWSGYRLLIELKRQGYERGSV
jgi:hypothetical protein